MNLRETLQPILDEMTAYVPNLLAALGVLVAGWLVALAVAAIVRRVLNKTTIDDKIAAWITGARGKGEEIESEKFIARVVFWVLMILVLVAFFQILGLTYVTEPLNNFLNQIFEYLPRLLSAGALLAVAWVLATGGRFAVEKALTAMNLDERLGASIEDEPQAAEKAVEPEGDDAAKGETGKKKPSLARSLADTVYWLVFLLFLPAVLDALALEGLLEPVNGLVQKVLSFLPQVLAAGVIIAVGWLVARIVRRIVTNLLGAAGVDSLSEKVGIERVLGSQRLSQVIGLIVYVLILIPVLIAGLNALQLEAITQPASDMLETVLAALPRLFAAGILLALAWVLAKVVGGLVSNLLGAIGFDRVFARLGFKLEPGEGKTTPADVAGTIVVIAVMLFASIEALNLLEFTTLSELVSNLTVFLGKVALGVVVFGIGLFLADVAASTVRATGHRQAALLATAARIAILVLAGAMALRQIDVAEDIINLAFGLVLGSIAVATAIAFGIGGRDVAKRHLERMDRSVSAGDGSS